MQARQRNARPMENAHGLIRKQVETSDENNVMEVWCVSSGNITRVLKEFHHFKFYILLLPVKSRIKVIKDQSLSKPWRFLFPDRPDAHSSNTNWVSWSELKAKGAERSFTIWYNLALWSRWFRVSLFLEFSKLWESHQFKIDTSPLRCPHSEMCLEGGRTLSGHTSSSHSEDFVKCFKMCWG